MREDDLIERTLAKIRAHLISKYRGVDVRTERIIRNNRRCIKLVIMYEGHRNVIYIYDDGDIAFEAEGDKFFVVEVWDERDDVRRVDRFLELFDKQVVSLNPPS